MCIMNIKLNHQCNVNNYTYLLGLYLVLEAQIPENVVNQVNQALVNQWNLPDNSPLGRVPATKEAESQSYCRFEMKDLHVKVFCKEE